MVANYASSRLKVKALSQGELLRVFSVLSAECSVAGNNFTANLILTLGHATRYATPENEWTEIILPYLGSSSTTGTSSQGFTEATRPSSASLSLERG